jgi:hypothetical protein
MPLIGLIISSFDMNMWSIFKERTDYFSSLLKTQGQHAVESVCLCAFN